MADINPVTRVQTFSQPTHRVDPALERHKGRHHPDQEEQQAHEDAVELHEESEEPLQAQSQTPSVSQSDDGLNYSC